MRTPQRSFVVEIKSARRRLKTQPASIWGNTDFGALLRDTEETLPFMQNATPETTVTLANRQHEAEQQIEVVDFIEGSEEPLGAMPSTVPDQIERRQHEAIITESEVSKIAVTEPERQKARMVKHRREIRASVAADAEIIPPDMPANDVAEVRYDELALLDAENLRLRQLYAEYLVRQNAQLLQMLKRFE